MSKSPTPRRIVLIVEAVLAASPERRLPTLLPAS